MDWQVDMTCEECCQRFRELGVSMHLDTLRSGIEQGVFPFGLCINMNNRKFLISRKKFEEWIEEFYKVKVTV